MFSSRRTSMRRSVAATSRLCWPRSILKSNGDKPRAIPTSRLAGPGSGRRPCSKLFMRLGAEWEGFTVTVHALHDAGEHVVMEGRYTGAYKPSNRSVDAQVCHVLRFREGKLLSFQQYVDTGQLQSVMATG